MRLAIATAMFIAAAAPAFGQGLSASEAKKIFFGYDMHGVLAGDNTKWRECIRASGETSYWFAGEYDQGRLRVRDDGALCFSYKSTNYQREGCFTAERTGEPAGANWRFTDVLDQQTIFITTEAHKVKVCPDKDAPIS